jgi:hypothetical protein
MTAAMSVLAGLVTGALLVTLIGLLVAIAYQLGRLASGGRRRWE